MGEAPGEQEDVQGRPFVGAAGKLLTELLGSVGLRREDVYITNIVKCRPPNNRPPRKDESTACRPYLDRQIRLITPRIICPMGNSAIHSLMDSEKSVTDLHGIPFEVGHLTFFPMYHPAVGPLHIPIEESYGAGFQEASWASGFDIWVKLVFFEGLACSRERHRSPR